MSRIVKALEKYKKERNLASSQMYNLDHAKMPASELEGGKDQTIQENVDAAAAKESTQPYPHQEEGIDSPAADSREASQPQADRPSSEPANIALKRRPYFVLADKQPAKPASTEIENKEETSLQADKNADPATQPPELTSAAPSEPTCACMPSNRFAPDLISIVNPRCIEAEIFKVLRGKILFPTSGEPPRSIMVTSAVPGEGKSFVASNLAVNMALNIEKHVLLVDGDIRRPTIHKLFGIGMVKGLSEHLSNGNKLPSLLLKTGVDKLTILPSGTPPANPSELLSSDKMAALIEELKSRYDDRFLIIDSPPPMLGPETIAIANRVDGIIVVIKFGSTPMDVVEELIDNLGKEKIIGAVINRFDGRTSRYYGYKKYRKYYHSKP
jgi:exopolysaccharide/PEP-CTERM locus tyrosine autokinase